jgi:hypothetical protein
LRALVTSALVCWCGYTSGWTCCARPVGPMVPRAHSYHWGCSTAGRSDIPVPKPTKQDLQPPARNNSMALSTTWSLPSNAIHVWQVSTRGMTGRRQKSDSDVSVRGSLGGLRGSPSNCSPHRLAKLRTLAAPQWDDDGVLTAQCARAAQDGP